MNTTEIFKDDFQHTLEQYIAFSVVTDPTLIGRMVGKVTPDMFVNEAFAFIFDTAAHLFGEGVAMDHLTLTAAMRARDPKLFKKYGGLSVLGEAMTGLRHVDNVMDYVAELKSLYLRRKSHSLLFDLQGKLANAAVPVGDALNDCLAALQLLMREGVDESKVKHVADLAREMMERHRNLAREGITSLGVSTGLYEFDYITGGLYKGEIAVLSARPSYGKTALAIHIALQVAMQGIPVMFFTLEMSEAQMTNRIIAALTDIAPESLRKSGMTEAELSELDRLINERLVSLPLSVVYLSAPRAEDIRAQVLLAVNGDRCGMVVVDYLHLMNTDSARHNNMVNAVGDNANALKQLAVDADIPLLLLSQMNRDVERRSEKVRLPMLADLRDSGVIEQVADTVVFIHRPDMQGITTDENGDSLEGVAKLLVMKCRNSGTGQARFRFNRTFTKLSDYKRFA